MLNLNKIFVITFIMLSMPMKSLALDLNGQLFDTDNLVSEDLDAEQIRLNMLNNRADEIMLTHARYSLVRSQYFYSNEGVVKLSEDYFTALTAWLNGLDQIRLSVVVIEELSDPANRDGIQSRLNALMLDLADLTGMHDKIRRRGLIAVEHLNLTRNFPAGYISEYDQILVAYNGHRQQLVSSFDDILGRVDISLKESLKETLFITQEIFNNYLVTSAINASTNELRIALETANSMLEAELLIEPLTNDIFRRKLKVANLLGTYNKRFAAETLYLESANLADEYIAQINGFELSENTKANSIFEINSLITDMNTAIANDDSSNGGKWLHVYLLYQTANEEIVPLCVAGIGRDIYNCQAMRSIQGLTLASIMLFDDVQLKYLEDTLIAVENGPLAVGN